MSSFRKEQQFVAAPPTSSACGDQQTCTEETLISSQSPSQSHSQHTTEQCSLSLSQCDSRPRGKVGRPLKYDGDINNPDLDDADRRKLRRRTANRLSARRVRDRRASMASELEAKVIFWLLQASMSGTGGLLKPAFTHCILQSWPWLWSVPLLGGCMQLHAMQQSMHSLHADLVLRLCDQGSVSAADEPYSNGECSAAEKSCKVRSRMP